MFGSTSSVLLAPAVAKDPPYDPVKAFAPVIQIARGPFILAVRSDLPINDLQDLISYAKANPGKLNYGSSGIGSLHHLFTEMLKHAARIDLTHIPYPGGSQSWTALQSGFVDLIFDSMPGPISSLQAGKARPIAVTGTSRLGSLKAAPMMASVRTFTEQGLPDVDVVFWFGIVAPAGTPPDIISRLNADLAASVNEFVGKREIGSGGHRRRGGFSGRIRQCHRKGRRPVARCRHAAWT